MRRPKTCSKCDQSFKRGESWMGSAGIALHTKCPGEEKTNLQKALEKKRFQVDFIFNPDKEGNTYELSKARLVVKAETREGAAKLGLDWLAGKWEHFLMEIKEK